ncbi:MAG: PKD-like domain-containing protein [Chitinophagia bacterium]
MTFQRSRFCLFIFCWLLINQGSLLAQLCTNPGQNPLNPFPVCGNLVFTQNSVPACNGLPMVTKCGGDGVAYRDFNPFYYQFTCYQTGKLCFNIKPHVLSDDYDWQLFDITGKDPMLIFTDPSLIVSANWSGSSGITGASLTAPNSNECASDPRQNISTFSRVPDLIQGHIYLLMVSHYTPGDQSGYDLNLSAPGGTAIITDPLMPAIQKATVVCSNPQIGLKINKPIQCSSIASNGSDFVVAGPTPITILSASGYKCSGDFDTDSITLQFSGNLVAGEYTISTKNGTDGNGIIDFCFNAVNPATAFTLQFTPVAQILPLSTTTCSGTEFSYTPVTGSGSSVPPDTYYTWTAPAGINFTGAQAQVTPSSALFGNLSISGAIAQTATYLVTPTGGGCTGQPFSLSVRILPTSIISSVSLSICSSNAFSFSPVNGSHGLVLPSSTYQYFPAPPATVITGELTGSGVSVQGVLTNLTDTEQIVPYQVIPVTGGCAGSPFTLTVTVFPVPAVLQFSQTVCEGVNFSISVLSNTTGIIPAASVYSWSVPTMSSSISGGASGTNTSFITGKLFSTATVALTATYLVRAATANCLGNVFSVTVWIKPTALIQATTLSICSGNSFGFTPTSQLPNRLPSTTLYSWNAPAGIGITGGGAATLLTNIQGSVSNATSSLKTATYIIIPVTAGCSGVAFTLLVQVKPIANVQNIACSVCTQNLFTVQPTDGVNGIIPVETLFTWIEKDSLSTSTGLPLVKTSRVISTRFYNLATTASESTLAVTPISGCGEGTAFSIVAAVLPKASIPSIKDTICSGQVFQILLQNQTNGAIPNATEYTWVSAVSNGWAGSLSGTSSNGIIQGNIRNLTGNINVLPLQVQPTSPGACLGNVFTLAFRVQLVANVAELSTTYCSGTAFWFTPVTGVNGSIPDSTHFIWQAVNTSAFVTGGLFTNDVNYFAGNFMSTASTPVALNYQVIPVTLRDGLACAGSPFTYTAQIKPIPTATIQSLGPSVICEGREVNLVAAEPGSYLWSNGSKLPAVSITSPQTITLQVTNNYGCTTVSAPFNVTVHPRPRAKFDLPDICLPDGNGTFINRSTIADSTQLQFTYNWSFGDLNNPVTSTLQNPTHRYSALGTYPVQLIVYSDKGCVDTLVQLLQSIYPQPKVFVTASDIQLCLGRPIQFFATANGMGFAPRKWFWSMSDGGGTSLQNPVWQFQKPGMQSAQVYFVNQKGCTSDTAAVSIPVYEKPKLKLPPTLTINRGDSIRLVPSLVSGNKLYFKWYPATYLNSDTASTPLSTPYDDITYQLQLTGEGYCMVTDTLHIKVMKMPEIPNAFSPNGDGIYDTWQIKYLQDYPNSSLEIFNRTGRLVYSSKGNGRAWDGTWEGKPVPVATYYYLIQLHNGQPPISGSVTVIR